MKHTHLPILKSDLIELYINQGLPYITVAEKLGRSAEGVRKALKRFAIPMRSVGMPKGGKQPPSQREATRNRMRGKLGPQHPAFKNARWKDKEGYILMSRPGGGSPMKEHRYIMEQHLGRPLDPWEEVDHKNRNKKDNSLDNLEVLFSEHKRRDWFRRRGLPIPPKA